MKTYRIKLRISLRMYVFLLPLLFFTLKGNGQTVSKIEVRPAQYIFKIAINDQREVIGVKVKGLNGVLTILSEIIKTDTTPGINFSHYVVTSAISFDKKVIYNNQVSLEQYHISKVDIQHNLALIALPGLNINEGLEIEAYKNQVIKSPYIFSFLMNMNYTKRYILTDVNPTLSKLENVLNQDKTNYFRKIGIPALTDTIIYFPFKYVSQLYPGSPFINPANNKVLLLSMNVDTINYVGVFPQIKSLKSFQELTESEQLVLKKANKNWLSQNPIKDIPSNKRQSSKIFLKPFYKDKKNHGHYLTDEHDTLDRFYQRYNISTLLKKQKSTTKYAKIFPDVYTYSKSTHFLFYTDLLELQARLANNQINSKQYSEGFGSLRTKFESKFKGTLTLLNAAANFSGYTNFQQEPLHSERRVNLKKSQKELTNLLLNPNQISNKENKIWREYGTAIFKEAGYLLNKIDSLVGPSLPPPPPPPPPGLDSIKKQLDFLKIYIDSLVTFFTTVINVITPSPPWFYYDASGLYLNFSYGSQDYSVRNFPPGAYSTPTSKQTNILIAECMNEAYNHMKQFFNTKGINILIIGHADNLPYMGYFKYSGEFGKIGDSLALIANDSTVSDLEYNFHPFKVYKVKERKRMDDLMSGLSDQKNKALAYLRGYQAEIALKGACPFINSADIHTYGVTHQTEGGSYRRVDIYVKFDIDFNKEVEKIKAKFFNKR